MVFSRKLQTRGVHSSFWGYVLVYAELGAATLAVKNIGSSVTMSSLTWRGSADHPQWLAANSAWGVRVYDERTAAFTMNGTEVYRFTLPIGSLITEYGFGVYMSAGSITAGISRWTERTVIDTFGGQQQVVMAVFGDSEHADFVGVWTDAFREALDGTFGIRCVNVLNYAVPSSNSLDALNSMEEEGLGIANYVFVGTATNNIQQDTPLSASIANLEDMLDFVAAAARRSIVGLLVCG